MKTENRTFIVSGGVAVMGSWVDVVSDYRASGLGKACVEDLVKTGGANVAILDMNADGGKSLTLELGMSAHFFACNVLDTKSIAKAVQEAAQWSGETKKPFSGVISAASIALAETILDRNGFAFNMGDVDMILGVNLRGTIDLVRQAVEQIAKVDADANGERGIVVIISSSAAYDGQKGQISYAASKGAVASMTLPMARDLARYGIRCVAIAPSLFETNMTSMMPHKVRSNIEATFVFPTKAGRPDEFAQLVHNSIENSMLNGAVIRLDGGSRPSKM